MDCSSPPRGFSDVILTLYNGTNAVSCYTPDNAAGEIVIRMKLWEEGIPFLPITRVECWLLHCVDSVVVNVDA